MTYYINHFSMDKDGNPIVTTVATQDPSAEAVYFDLPKNMDNEQWHNYWNKVKRLGIARLINEITED